MLLPVVGLAQTTTQPQPGDTQVPKIEERVEVVATRLPEVPEEVPTPVEVFSGADLRARGVTDLRGALALATGVDVTPGGDGGPASAVPEFWGLREFDAFLLVVDGVPWGGAFNPALSTLSLADVERIEVMRGPAPVMFGATSFVGVVNVVHRSPSADERLANVRVGSYSSGGGMLASKIPFVEGWNARLTVDADRQGYSDDRTSYQRGHGLFRAERSADGRRTWFGVDFTYLDQDPGSPRPRTGTVLSPLVPIDANQQPDGAFLNDRRVMFLAGHERGVGAGIWTTTASISRASHDGLNGFLTDVSDTPDNATGLRLQIDLTDVYVDSHVSWKVRPQVTFVAGGDYLHGSGTAHGADFTYTASLDGLTVPQADVPTTLDVTITDRRDFVGGYAFTEWHPVARLRVDAGVRLNVTNEEHGGIDPANPSPSGSDSGTQTNARLSGVGGVTWSAWQQGNDSVHLYAEYRNTFKPAAVDFGLDSASSEGPLLPETSQSVDGGLKTRVLDGQVAMEISAFLMNFENLVIPRTVDGLPALTNSGSSRYKGLETSVAWFLPSHITGRASYSLHDSRFVDYAFEFDPGVPTQLAGKQHEMSARHMASVGVLYSPPAGVTGALDLNYVGSRYMNMRNTALADGFATVRGMVGYSRGKWDLRLLADNLTDQRPPSAESELGDAQYYLLPARRIDLTFGVRF